jgi:hypothetical protein
VDAGTPDIPSPEADCTEMTRGRRPERYLTAHFPSPFSNLAGTISMHQSSPEWGEVAILATDNLGPLWAHYDVP